MLRRRLTPLLLLALCGPAGAAGLREVGRIDLPGVEGRIDHLAADPDGKRLYIAALGNDTLEVIDLPTGRRVASVKGLKKPQGVRYLPDFNRLVVASGDDGACRFIDPTTLKVTAAIKGLPDADNVRYDASSKRAYVGYGEGALAVIDAATEKKVAEIKLDGHPESFQLDARGERAFANVPDAGHVASIDLKQGHVAAKWPLPDGVAANFPMALDETHGRLFVGCRKPAKLLALDTNTGQVLASTNCAGDADDVFYDTAHDRVYVTGGDGSISVIRHADGDKYESAETVPTAAGARTSLFVPSLNRLYVAVPHRGAQRAEVRVFEVAPK